MRLPFRRPGTLPACWLAITLWLGLAAAGQAAPTVQHYEAFIEPDIARGTLKGSVALRVQGGAAPEDLLLDAAALAIDAVREEGSALRFERIGTRLRIALPAAGAVQPATRRIEIDFHGQPASGMRFNAAANEVFTVFSTSQWMPCIDAPDARATLSLHLLLPAGLKAVGNGRLQRSETLANGKALTIWQQEQAVPSYLFGFAAGPFRELLDDSAMPTLRFLAPQSFSEEDLQRVFADTRRMLAFYESRAGLPYPGTVYTQVLVTDAAAQEMAGFAVMGQNYGRRVLADEHATWLGAHELSHQWWGNGVTNRAWTEFWLNEGIASFMNAAWFEHRWGRDDYLRHIHAARDKFEAIRGAGADKPLVFASWNRPTPQDRSLAYDKGAWVVHLLRERMGDAAFWAGLQRYTQQFWGNPVSSRDFQAVMQAAAPGTDLSAFFNDWVHPRP